jgi:predicted nucleotidyltransferase
LQRKYKKPTKTLAITTHNNPTDNDHTRFGLTKRDMMTLHEILCRYPDVKSVYIFGSRAMGTHKFGSDIDLAVMNPDLSDTTLRRLQAEFEESSLPYPVDILCVSEKLDNAVKEHIARVAKIVYQA